MSDTNVRAFNMLKILSNVGSVALALNAVRNNEPGASEAFWHSASDLTTWALETTRRRIKQKVGLGAEEGLDSIINKLKNFFENTADCYPQVSKMNGGIIIQLSVRFGVVNGESVGFSIDLLPSTSTFMSLQNATNHQDIYNAIKAIMKNNGIDSIFSDGTLTLTVDNVNICSSSDAGYN